MNSPKEWDNLQFVCRASVSPKKRRQEEGQLKQRRGFPPFPGKCCLQRNIHAWRGFWNLSTPDTNWQLKTIWTSWIAETWMKCNSFSKSPRINNWCRVWAGHFCRNILMPSLNCLGSLVFGKFVSVEMAVGLFSCLCCVRLGSSAWARFSVGAEWMGQGRKEACPGNFPLLPGKEACLWTSQLIMAFLTSFSSREGGCLLPVCALCVWQRWVSHGLHCLLVWCTAQAKHFFALISLNGWTSGNWKPGVDDILQLLAEICWKEMGVSSRWGGSQCSGGGDFPLGELMHWATVYGCVPSVVLDVARELFLCSLTWQRCQMLNVERFWNEETRSLSRNPNPGRKSMCSLWMVVSRELCCLSFVLTAQVIEARSFCDLCEIRRRTFCQWSLNMHIRVSRIRDEPLWALPLEWRKSHVSDQAQCSFSLVWTFFLWM